MSINGILGGAIERLDMQMLLDPFEEQFHVPAFAVELCYGQSLITHMVGQEAVYDTRGEVFVSNHPKFFGVGLGGLIGGEFDDFVSNYAGSFVNGAGLDDFILHIVFCPGHAECAILVYPVEESEKVDISFGQQVDGSHLDAEFVQGTDIMYGSVCEVYKHRNITSQVQLSVHLDPSFCLPELGPGAKLQTKTDGAAVEGIYGIVQVHSKRIIGIQRPHLVDQDIRVDMPIAKFIRLCQRVTGNSVANATVIELMGDRRQTSLDVSETVLVRILSHAHHEELIVTGEVPDTIVPVVAGNAIVELASWYERHNLSENGASFGHGGYITGIVYTLKNAYIIKNNIVIDF